jgi:TonB family protein
VSEAVPSSSYKPAPAGSAFGAAFGLSACLHAMAVIFLCWLPAAPVKEPPAKPAQGAMFVKPDAGLRSPYLAPTAAARVAPDEAPGTEPAEAPPAELSRSDMIQIGSKEPPHESMPVVSAVLSEAYETETLTEGTPVEILERPAPTYTGEALARGLQGDVVLEVLFRASGELRVLGIVRGLGHGLDEAAVRAAERMLYWPARRHGRPVDCKAIIRVPFRLP